MNENLNGKVRSLQADLNAANRRINELEKLLAAKQLNRIHRTIPLSPEEVAKYNSIRQKTDEEFEDLTNRYTMRVGEK